MNKKGRVICEFETMKFKESFVCWRSNLTNDNISSAYAGSENGYGFRDPGLKTGVENDNYLVLNRVRVLRTGRHTDHGFPGIPHPQSYDKKKKNINNNGSNI